MTTFVAGVHGAGKTFATKPACQKLGLVYATASQLIQEERGQVTWDGTKMVSDVDKNQAALISAVRRIRESGSILVIDGHFVLRRAPGTHERLPIDVFRALECSSVLLIRSPVPVLLERLHARQDMSWSEAELADFSKAEDAHSAEVADVLGIPLQTLDTPTAQEVETWLKRLL
ncbi:ATP-binding protein [Comamonas testosteroni]|uniref:ATP-binding protein n=1 Tax=Comamonas testosteroni TaxID=285 RepID=UPI0023AACA41|nr:ATP-binding protein [Comamonas testosteroni]WEE76667.1 ATP-binding protein [Comamonas testosteroni]